jgi:hypothetical protein
MTTGATGSLADTGTAGTVAPWTAVGLWTGFPGS